MRRRREEEGIPEKNILRVDPEQLIKNNPAAFIINTGTYDALAAGFSPGQLDKPQVAWVMVNSGSKFEPGLRIVDGHTRTLYASRNKGRKVPGYPNFRFNPWEVRDVTESLLKNPLINPARSETQGVLTIEQYLRAVIRPTIVHSNIASDRIALHLINGWRSMVGDQMASRFSGSAAIASLAKIPHPFQNVSVYDEALRRQRRFVVDETSEERDLILESLFRTSEIIREADLDPREVFSATFLLVGESGEIIGGKDEAKREVFGLLHAPEVELKLKAETVSIAQTEQLRLRLGNATYLALKRFARRGRETDFAQIHDALLNPNLNLKDTIKIVQSTDPQESFKKVLEVKNRASLENYYLNSIGKSRTDITPVEARMIKAAGENMHLDHRDISGLARSIRKASSVIYGRAKPFLTRLEEDRETLIEQGLSPEHIDQVSGKVQKDVDALLSMYAANAISRKTSDIEKYIAEEEKNIRNQINRRAISSMINEEAAQIISEHGEAITLRIINFLYQSDANPIKKVDAATALLRKLARLDNDLLTSVLGERIKLDRALKEQDERAQGTNKIHAAPVTIRIEGTTQGDIFSVKIPTKDRPQKTEPIDNKAGAGDIATQRRLEQKRIDLNNKRLSESVGNLSWLLDNAALRPEEVYLENVQSVRELVKKLVCLIGPDEEK